MKESLRGLEVQPRAVPRGPEETHTLFLSNAERYSVRASKWSWPGYDLGGLLLEPPW
jgi:hypothetical protein